jgi:quercetin dioxygenase-like cupin family protein
MKITSDADITSSPVRMEGAEGVTMRILVGPDDGSENIIMRLFSVEAGGCTPRHTHPYEHLVKVVSGKGHAMDAEGKAHEIVPGQNVYVVPDEMHQFRNPGPAPFVFTCTIPNPDKKSCCA